MAGETGVVAREPELAAIAGALDDHRCHGVALIGPAGVGKSHLAQAAQRLAEERGMACLSVVATPAASTIAFGALAHLLPPSGELADIHDDLRPAQLIHATQLALREAGDGAAVLLAIDDAHLLDPTSAHLVAQLAVVGAVTLLMTIRSGDLAPPAAVSTLWKDGVVERIDVRELDQRGTTQLAQHLLGGTVDAPAASWLHRTSDGNALYARELVLGARDSGALVRRDTRWSLGSSADTVSPRLSELVDQRLGDLDAAGRRALDLIALAEPIGLDLAAEIVGQEVLGSLDDRGLLLVVAGGHRVELRPAHPLYGEALRQRPLTLRRRSDLAALVRAVQSYGARRRDDAVRLALWQQAGGEAIDPEVLLRAAVASQSGFDDPGAVRSAELGLAQRELDPAVTAELRLCAARSLARLGAFGRADAHLARAQDAAVGDSHRFGIVLLRSFSLFESADDLDGALAVLDEAAEGAAAPRWRDELRLQAVTVQADGGRTADAAAALDALGPVDPAPAVQIALRLATSATLAGQARWTETIAASQAGYDLHLAHADADTPYHPVSQLWPRMTALHRGGWHEPADEVTAQFLADAVSEGRPISIMVGRLQRARLLLDAGRVGEARVLAVDAHDGASHTLQPYLQRWAVAVLAWVEAVSGHVHAAADLVAQRPGGQRMSTGMGAVEVVLGPVVALTSAQRRTDAQRLLRAGIAAAVADGDVASLVELLAHDVIAFGSRASALQLAALVPSLDREAPTTAAWSAVATAGASGRHADWADAASAFLAVGRTLVAAHVADAAAGAADLAGERRAATAHRSWARDLRSRCTGIADGHADRAEHSGLTDREAEIASLVAEGRTSKEVAARLVVSSRTVDNHLQRIYVKLGVTNRRELAEALRRR